MSWTDCVCVENENHNGEYAECLMCEIERLGEYAEDLSSEVERSHEENRLLRDQVARLQASTGASVMRGKNQRIEALEEQIEELRILAF